MAEQYRIVEPDMWVGDDWFADLPPDGKLLYIYLFTNPHGHLSGVYRLAQRTIANETGLPVARVAELLAMFEELGKLVSDNGWRFVVRMQSKQLRGTISPQMRKHIDGYLEGCPSQAILTAYRKAYPSDTLSDGYREGIESPSNTVHSTQDINTDTKEEDDDLFPKKPNIFALYQDNIGMIESQMLSEKLKAAEREYPAHWLSAAFQIAVENDARNWRYIEAVLQNWRNGKNPAPILKADGTVEVVSRTNGNSGAHKRAAPVVDRQRARLREALDAVIES